MYTNIKTNGNDDTLLKNEMPKILSPMIDVIFKLLMGTECSKDLLLKVTNLAYWM